MRDTHDEGSFGPSQVLLVEVKQFSQVHGLELLVEDLLVDGDHDDGGASEQVEVLLLFVREVQEDVGDVDSLLVWLPRDLVHGVETEWPRVLGQQVAKALNECLRLRTVPYDSEVVRETNQLAEASLFEHVRLRFVPVAQPTIEIEEEDWQLDALSSECLFGYE